MSVWTAAAQFTVLYKLIADGSFGCKVKNRKTSFEEGCLIMYSYYNNKLLGPEGEGKGVTPGTQLLFTTIYPAVQLLHK